MKEFIAFDKFELSRHFIHLASFSVFSELTHSFIHSFSFSTVQCSHYFYWISMMTMMIKHCRKCCIACKFMPARFIPLSLSYMLDICTLRITFIGYNIRSTPCRRHFNYKKKKKKINIDWDVEWIWKLVRLKLCVLLLLQWYMLYWTLLCMCTYLKLTCISSIHSYAFTLYLPCFFPFCVFTVCYAINNNLKLLFFSNSYLGAAVADCRYNIVINPWGLRYVNSKHIHHFGRKKVKWKNMDQFLQCTWYHADTIRTLNNGNIKSIRRYGFSFSSSSLSLFRIGFRIIYWKLKSLSIIGPSPFLGSETQKNYINLM